MTSLKNVKKIEKSNLTVHFPQFYSVDSLCNLPFQRVRSNRIVNSCCWWG